MRTSLRRAIAMAPIAALLLVGCSGSDEEPGGDGAPTAGEQTTGAPGGGGGVAVYDDIVALNEAINAQRLEDGTQGFEITSDSTDGITGTGQTRVDDAGSASRLQIDVAEAGAGAQQLEVIALPGEVFLMLPPGQEVEPGKPWLRIAQDAQDPFSQLFGPLIDQLSTSVNPLSQFEGAQDAFTITGTTQEERDGEPVVVYTLEIDLQRLAEAQAEAAGQPVPPVEPGQELPNATAEYVLDGEDRLRESIATVAFAGASEEVVRTTFSGWGEPVEIVAPPAELVAGPPA